MTSVIVWVRRAATATAIAVAALLVAAFGPTLLGARSLIVTSGSMEPVMPVGSVVLTRPVDARAIAVDDIITFRFPGSSEPTTHRVLAIERADGVSAFTTKGDANDTADPERVLVRGNVERVQRVVPFAGSVVAFARSPLGAFLLLGIPIAGLTWGSRTRPRPEPAHARCPGCGNHALVPTGTEG